MTERRVTAELAEWIAGLTPADIPDEVKAEGVRTFVNWYGCALGGADHPSMDAALKALSPFGPAPTPISPVGSTRCMPRC